MRIFSDQTDNYLHALAASIRKDPASLEGWRCVHIAHTKGIPHAQCARALRMIKEQHTQLDCDAVHGADNDVFFICRNIEARALYALAHELIEKEEISEQEGAEITFYDIYLDWRDILNRLVDVAGEPTIAIHTGNIHEMGDLVSLQDALCEAKLLRRSRLPVQILVVEDDPVTRRLVTGSFKDKYSLLTASNAEEAILNYLLHAPDVVFLDIGLPGMSGFDVLRQIMASDPDAYVVMFSGNSYLDNVTNALSAGAAGFIAKPFKKDKMQCYIADGALHHGKYI